jgi:predicted MFS family arabinose efflux permease
VLYSGLVIGAFGSVLCGLTGYLDSFGLLLLARFIMALGTSVGLKIAFTIIGDVYEESKAAKVISNLVMAFALVPSFALAIGGFLTEYFNWQSCFYFTALYCLFVLLLCTRLQETGKKQEHAALQPLQILKGYLNVLKNPFFITATVLIGLGSSIILTFTVKAPFIGIELLNLSPEAFGLLSMIPPFGLILGSLAYRALSTHLKPIQMTFIGVSWVFLIAATVLALFSFGIINVWTLFIPMPFMIMGTVLSYTHSSALVMGTAVNKSNTSAMMNFMNVASTVVWLFALGAIYPQNILIMPIFFFVMGILMILLAVQLFFYLKKYKRL